MNVLLLSYSTEEIAKKLDDVRLNKFILESAQMISMAIYRVNKEMNTRFSRKRMKENPGLKSIFKDLYGIYLPTHHVNHPWTVWTATTYDNYHFHLDLFIDLLNEYEERKEKKHACEKLLDTFYVFCDIIPAGSLTEFPNCARKAPGVHDFTHIKNVHLAYRKYYVSRLKADTIKTKWSGVIRSDYERIVNSSYLDNSGE